MVMPMSTAQNGVFDMAMPMSTAQNGSLAWPCPCQQHRLTQGLLLSPQMPKRMTEKETRLVLVRGFRGFSPSAAGSITLSLRKGRHLGDRVRKEEGCLSHGGQEAKRKKTALTTRYIFSLGHSFSDLSPTRPYHLPFTSKQCHCIITLPIDKSMD